MVRHYFFENILFLKLTKHDLLMSALIQSKPLNALQYSPKRSGIFHLTTLSARFSLSSPLTLSWATTNTCEYYVFNVAAKIVVKRENRARTVRIFQPDRSH